MKSNVKKIALMAAFLVAVCGGVLFMLRPTPAPQTTIDDGRENGEQGKVVRQTQRERRLSGRKLPTEAEESDDVAPQPTGREMSDDDAESQPTDAAADLEERLVDEFDSLTDKWQDPAADKVTMAEVNKFRDQFGKVPNGRKEECVQRALNLIPDENVMLLAGILFDKSQDAEILEAIYNDILNRDESVKEPILREIFKDKEHPCWADTAWILDVTGELPKKTGEGK